MTRSRHLLVVAAGAAVATVASAAAPSALAAPAQPQPRYMITDLGTLAGSDTDAGNLNDRGDVTGGVFSETAVRGFLWKDGRLTDIGTLGGPQGAAGPINNSGQFTGWADLTTPAPPSIFNTESFFCNPPAQGEPAVACRAFLSDHGEKIDLGTLGGLNSAAENKGLNQRGHVAGVAETASVDPTSPIGAPIFHAFLWRSGKMLDLGILGAGPDSVANAVNDRDQVIGVDVAADSPNGVAWLWQDGRKTALGNLGGASTNAFALNNRGQVVGKSQIGSGEEEHAFLWQGGRMSDLGALPGDDNSEAFDINEQGQVVGISCTGQFPCHPVIWTNGIPVDVNTLLPAASGWQLFDANAVNERGQIVGGGINADGQFHAYLLTPAP